MKTLSLGWLMALLITLPMIANAQNQCSASQVRTSFQQIADQFDAETDTQKLQELKPLYEAASILVWQTEGRSLAGKETLIVFWMAGCYSDGECGLPEDYALSRRLYDDMNSGFVNNVFGRELPDRPPASAIQYARGILGCDSQTNSAPSAPIEVLNPTQKLARAMIAFNEQRYADAYPAFDELCAQNVAAACHYVGLFRRTGTVVEQDDVLARQGYKKGCDGDFFSSCTEYGRYLFNGLGGEQNYPGARSAYEKACNDNQHKACGYLGDMIYRGLGGDENLEQARKLTQRSCDNGDGFACLVLGNVQSSFSDFPLARSSYERGCKFGDDASCSFFASSLHDFAFGPVDAERGQSILKDKCDEGSGVACFFLANQSIDNSPVAPDVALHYNTRACELAFVTACDALNMQAE